MKLEVGMYCYNKVNRKLGIGKIKRFGINNNVLIIYKNNIELVSKGNVIASFNIIDLISVGDYVNGKKIVDVGCLTNGPIEGTKVIDYYITPSAVSYLENEDIKSIVTKELFEIAEYRIGE